MNSSLQQNEMDPSLLELFRVEMENHTRVLESGLIELEKNAEPKRVEPLMRAAHSIKGAARIVGLAGGVELAHAMEDLLSAVQRREVKINARQIDLLLRGNDFFKQLAGCDPVKIPQIIAANSTVANLLEQELRMMLSVAPAADSGIVQQPLEVTEEQAAPQPEAGAGFVRVPSDSLSRLMGLASEVLILNRKLARTISALRRLRSAQEELRLSLEKADKKTLTGFSHENLQVILREQKQQMDMAGALLEEPMAQLFRFSRRMEQLAGSLYDETVASRMRPFGDGVRAFARMTRDLARARGKQVQLRIEGENTPVDRDILERLEAPLIHLLRNALDHGLEPAEQRRLAGKPAEGSLVLEAWHRGGVLHIVVRDDGAGIDFQALREKIARRGDSSPEMVARMTQDELIDFLFLPGFSTAGVVTDISGRGVGLDVVRSTIQQIGGTVRVKTSVGHGTSFHLQLPLTLSVLSALLVTIAGEFYAVPLSRVERLHVREQPTGHQSFFEADNARMPVISARQLLALPGAGDTVPFRQPLLLLRDRSRHCLVAVDRLIGQRELVVLPLDQRMGLIPGVTSGALTDDGLPVLILDVDYLVHGAALAQASAPPANERADQQAVGQGKNILIVEDSLTAREMARNLLMEQGYVVHVALDGVDGWQWLQQQTPDLIITDVDMPRASGLELTRRVRRATRLAHLPVVMVSYNDRPEDHKAGLAAGANCYLAKSSLQDGELLQTVRNLIGQP